MLRTKLRHLLLPKIRVGSSSWVRALSSTKSQFSNENEVGLDLFKLSQQLSGYLNSQDPIPVDGQSAWTDSEANEDNVLSVESFQQNDDTSAQIKINTNKDTQVNTHLNRSILQKNQTEVKPSNSQQTRDKTSRQIALYKKVLQLEKIELALKKGVKTKSAPELTQPKSKLEEGYRNTELENNVNRKQLYSDIIRLMVIEKETVRTDQIPSPFAILQHKKLEAGDIRPPDQAVIRRSLDSLSLLELKERCRSYGISMNGNKSDIIERIEKFILDFGGDRRSIPQNIISIDIGYRNLAYVHIDSSLRILDWRRINLNVPDSYNPVEYARVVNDFVETLSNRDVGIYIIERQSLRHSPTTMFEAVVRSNLVEALIIGSLHGRGYSIASINPITISSYLKSEKGSALLRNAGIVYTDHLKKLKLLAPSLSGKQYSSKRYAVKKTNHVGVVKHLLKTDQVIQCPPNLEEMFLNEKKKDDLADCLIQSLVWYEWQHTRLQDIYAQILNVKSSLL